MHSIRSDKRSNEKSLKLQIFWSAFLTNSQWVPVGDHETDCYLHLCNNNSGEEILTVPKIIILEIIDDTLYSLHIIFSFLTLFFAFFTYSGSGHVDPNPLPLNAGVHPIGKK